MNSRYFTSDEMKCQHCGKENWQPEFMEELDILRRSFGKPMIVTSGYRCPEHPIEAKKERPGAHSTGLAVDIAVRGEDTIELTSLAYTLGFRRIGWNQKGNSRFVHLDKADLPNGSWSY